MPSGIQWTHREICKPFANYSIHGGLDRAELDDHCPVAENDDVEFAEGRAS